MTTDDHTTPVTGPIPIYVKAIPGGAQLDLSALTALVVGDVLDALLDPENTSVWDRLHELAEGEPALTPEDRLPYEELVSDLAGRCSSRVPLYGPAALELTRRLREAVAPKAIPAQQDRRAS